MPKTTKIPSSDIMDLNYLKILLNQQLVHLNLPNVKKEALIEIFTKNPFFNEKSLDNLDLSLEDKNNIIDYLLKEKIVNEFSIGDKKSYCSLKVLEYFNKYKLEY